MPSLPALNPRDTALFLDFDGTLAELAAQPGAVRVPDRLVPLLDHLREHLQGALALVTGRPLAELDALLAPLCLPAAAEHGAVRRGVDGRQQSVPTPNLKAVTRVASALARQHAGLQVELKTAAVALHYRQAPALESLCLQHLSRAVMATPGVELLHGKCVIEVKPLGVNKGRAIAAFMREPPFAGRTPWFAGDDATDEAGFAWVQSVGGQCLKVGAGPSLARHRCANPQALRQWLAGPWTSCPAAP
jgi:trehalose 6-phosphate phosphatase